MQTIDAHAAAEYTDRQSRFLAHLVPFRDSETTLARLRCEHPKARHFVTAYRRRNAYGQTVEGSSDDGEPKGTSGKPALAVLAGHDLMDVAVIVVRYFGGTKLGTGGLVRAYGRAVNDAVAAARLLPFTVNERFAFGCGYADVGRVEHALQHCGIGRVEKEFGAEGVHWEIEAPAEALALFREETGRRITPV